MAIREKNGKFEVNVYFGKDKKTGKRISRSETFSKISEARRRERELKQLKETAADATFNGNILLGNVYQEYLTYIRNNRPSNTYLNYKSDMESKIIPTLGLFSINRITLSTLDDFIQELRANNSYAPNTLNRVISTLKSFFNWATHSKDSVLSKDPSRGLEKFKITKNTEFKFWENDEVDLFLNEIELNPYRDLYVFLLNTGLRISEALSLTVDKYLATRGVITVDRQVSKYVAKTGESKVDRAVVFGPLKNCEPRKIALNYIAAEIVARNCSNKSRSDFIFEPLRKRKSDLRNVIYSRGSRPIIKKKFCLIANNFYKDQFLKLIEKTDLPNIGLHGLRHTFASHFVMNGGDLYALQKILGHKNIANTQIYAHLSDSYLAESKDIVTIGNEKVVHSGGRPLVGQKKGKSSK